MATRLTLRVVKAIKQDPPAKIIFLGDSQTILASRERDKGFFGEFFGNRVGESFDNEERIMNLVDLDEKPSWYHVPSEDNASDRATRMESRPEDLQMGTPWQEGPAYLKEEMDKWPISRDFMKKGNNIKLPVEEIRKPYRERLIAEAHKIEVEKSKVKISPGPSGAGNYVMEHFKDGYSTNDWEELLMKTSYLFYWRAKKELKDLRSRHTNKEFCDMVETMAYEMAYVFWIRSAQKETNQAAALGRLKTLNPKQHKHYPDLLVVSGRVQPGRGNFFGRDFLPILMKKTRVAHLIMMHSHNQDHGGIDSTLLTSLQTAWIIGGRALARSVKRA